MVSILKLLADPGQRLRSRQWVGVSIHFPSDHLVNSLISNHTHIADSGVLMKIAEYLAENTNDSQRLTDIQSACSFASAARRRQSTCPEFKTKNTLMLYYIRILLFRTDAC